MKVSELLRNDNFDLNANVNIYSGQWNDGGKKIGYFPIGGVSSCLDSVMDSNITYITIDDKGCLVIECDAETEKKSEATKLSLFIGLKPCETVWIIRPYDDGQWWNLGAFPMMVKEIRPYGAIEQTGDGPVIWHICLEDNRTAVRINFSEIDKTLFLTEEEAKAALDRKNEEDAKTALK